MRRRAGSGQMPGEVMQPTVDLRRPVEGRARVAGRGFDSGGDVASQQMPVECAAVVQREQIRRITVPLLAPVLVVVMVTLMINVLKIFDLVYIIAPGQTQSNANVLALQLYLSSFGGGNDQGVGSAIGVILLLLVLPVMIINIRRLRREGRR